MLSSKTHFLTQPLPIFHLPARTGETRDILGARLTFKVESPDTGGSYFVGELTVPPQAGVPLHSHPECETFYVLEGELEFLRLDGETAVSLAAGPGTVVFIPHLARHGLRNVTESPARALVITEPGLEDYFREAGELVDPAAAFRTAPPTPEEIGRTLTIATEHGQTFYEAAPAEAA
jgi:quercetin dioxygenase-like cupin family protein